MRLVFIGPPGAGKGTQAAVLSNNFKIPSISTGDILREAIKSNSPIGLKAKSYMEKGELVSDDIVVGIVADRIKKPDTKNGFILDGFPRTINQAERLDAELGKLSIKLDRVIYFDTKEATVIARLSGRRICKNCGANFHVKNIPPKVEGICDKCGEPLYQREDDKEATVKNRLQVYNKQTASLIDHYKNEGILRTVSGDLDVNEVFAILKDLFKKEHFL